MANNQKSTFLDARIIKAITPLALALLLLIAVSGVFIYPFIFSARGLGSSDMSVLADKLLITALVALLGALIPAAFTSFAKENFSITYTLVLSLTGAVFFSWIAMLAQQVIIGDIGGFSGAVLSITLSALVGSVLSVVPALLATLLCVLRRIIASLIAEKKEKAA